jgi:hypothetical protein
MAMVPPLISAVVLILRPGSTGPMSTQPDYGLLVLALALIGTLVGELWIHRIMTAVGKDDDTTWRYRDR